jgi:ferredoxin
MKSRIITAPALDKLISGWLKNAAVFAPARTEGREWTEFRRITTASEMSLDRVNTRLPAKGLVFPQCEVLLRFRTGDPASAREPDPPAEQVIFGIRPCDAAAVAFLDRFFAGSGETDTAYQRRRERTTLVGLACNTPSPTCFCSAVGGSPSGTRGLDLLLTDIGGKFLAEPVTDKGERLIADMPDPAIGDLERRKELAAAAEAAISLRIDTKTLKQRLDSGFLSPLWEELCFPCVNCGVCTFACPTCHCFDVTDEERRGRGARMRVWDSCQFSAYTQHASGHNPRVTPESRQRNRVMDKWSYTVDMVGELSCVGCGRCVIACPAGIDIRETVATLLLRLPEK